MQNGCSFFSFSPVIFLGNITAIAPFEYKIFPKKSKTILHIPTFILAIFNLCFYVLSFTYTVISDDYSNFIGKGIPNIYLYVELASVYAGCVTVSALTFFRFRNVDNLAIVFQYLNEIEKLFKNLDCAIDYKGLRRRFRIVVLSQTLIYVSYLSLASFVRGGFSSYERLPSIYVNFTASYHMATSRFMCASFVMLVRIFFHQLNIAVQKIFEVTNSRQPADDVMNNKHVYSKRFSNKLTDKDMLQKLDLIVKAYGKICDCSLLLDEYFSGINLSVMFLSFLITLFNTFSIMILFIGIFTTGLCISASQVCLHFMRCFGNISNLYILINMCNMCEREVRNYLNWF